ncbi:MAG TPA: hypothetical protein VM406_08185, partial [Noviherbaspirillum sp.]|nr:hypothetical protein [Noviherbaspirillum sp.]
LVRTLRFILLSLALHLVLLSGLSWKSHVPLTLQPQRTAAQRLDVHLLSPPPPEAVSTAHAPARPAPDTSQASAALSDRLAPAPPAPPPSAAAALPAPAVIARQTVEYMEPERLTRPPVPLARVRLNTREIRGVGFEGSVVLTLLVDRWGAADVLVPPGAGLEEEFAALVAAQFRKVRFAPGEIDGQPVHSRVQITVISEPDLVQSDF